MTSTSNNDRTPRISARGPNFVQVVVGEEEVIFNVHEKLLTHYSPFFKKALSGNFREADDKEVLLPLTSPTTFEFLVHWLYYNRFPGPKDDEELFDLWTSDDDQGITKTGNLIDLYVLCDNYDVPVARVRVIDELFCHLKDLRSDTVLPTDAMVSYAFENLPEDSRMCNLLVDMHCYYASQRVWNVAEQD
ncbi:hypothetical protein NX059_009101 [Plenodomus lindquistii]|nr:hypothetical protein NX059_009101 [Plenodomus lindquistii]